MAKSSKSVRCGCGFGCGYFLILLQFSTVSLLGSDCYFQTLRRRPDIFVSIKNTIMQHCSEPGETLSNSAAYQAPNYMQRS